MIKPISFDEEVIRKLSQEDNASALVNRIVKEYYDKTTNPYEKMSYEEMLLEKQAREIRKKAEEQIKELKNG